MKIGIIGAMAEEIQHLKEVMTIEDQQILSHQAFYPGRLGNKDVVLVQSGIGKVNAAITATILIQKYGVDLVLNTGTAGALDPGLKVGDIVLADSLMHHDVDVTGFGYEIGQMAGMPARYYPELTYVPQFKAVCRAIDLEPVQGLIVSGDEFVNRPDRQAWIQSNFPKAKAVEMESAAIAQTCFNFQVPFMIVRAISDSADHQAAISFDEFVQVAGKISASIVSEFVQSIES